METKELPLTTRDKQIIEAARLMAANCAPFFSPLVRLLTIVRDDNLTQTMCVDQTGLVSYNLQFIRDTVAAEGISGLAFILLHESMHLLGMSYERGLLLDVYEDDHKHSLFRIASDLSINSMLKAAFERPGVTGDMPMPKFPDSGILPELLNLPPGKSAEEYYGILVKQYPKQLPQQCDGNGKPGAGCGVEKGEGNGEGKKPGKKPRQNISQAKIDSTKREMANAAKKSGNGRGDNPFGSFLDVEEIPPPRVDWRQHLTHATMVYTEMTAGMEDKTFMRRNVRQFDGIDDPILAGWCDYEKSIAVIGDTSGSMSGDLAKLVSEVEEIAKLVGPVTFIACDAAVHSVGTVTSAQDVVQNLKGGGGTSMVPAFEEAKKLKPSVIICITDGAIGHTPRPGEIPVIWCLTQDYRHDVAQSEKDGWSTIVECW